MALQRFLKFRRSPHLPRAQPSARLLEEICLSEGFLETSLAARCEDPPPYRNTLSRQYLRRGIAPICLFIGYRASIAEIPLFVYVCVCVCVCVCGGGVSHLHFACSPRGKRSEKGEGVSQPIGHMLRRQKPNRAQPNGPKGPKIEKMSNLALKLT